MSESWHTLLAAIPKDVRVNRRPVIPPHSTGATATPVFDWETLTIELSDGNVGAASRARHARWQGSTDQRE